jgi:peptidoglycan/LPS O-acetylase OafA/YrhL
MSSFAPVAPAEIIQARAPAVAAGYVPNLDGLRATAIAGVLLHHAPAVAHDGPLAALQANGRYGVGLFFVISGYLITTLLRRERAKTGTVKLGRFYARRSLRLLPLYYAALGVYVVLVLGLHAFSPDNQQLFREKLFAYLFYYANLVPHATQGPFFFAWSLAAEEQFYAVFGAAFRWLSGRLVAFGALAAIALKLALYMTVGPIAMSTGVLSVVFSYQEAILLGVVIAFGLETARGGAIARWLGRPAPLAVSALTIGTLLLAAPIGAHNLARAELLYLAMGAAIAGCVKRAPIGILEAAPVAHLGRISYGIYLFHMLALDPLKRALPGSPWLVLSLGTLVSIAVATLANRLVERPILAWRDRSR